MLLAADIGGTKAWLGLFELRHGRLSEVASRRYETADFPDLPALVRSFLEGVDAEPEAAGFGVAGPVVRGRARGTNLPWTVEVTAR